MEPERRVEIAKKIVSVAGDHGIPPEDVIIDPLAMPIGAEPRAVTLFLETLHLLRDELGVNTTCGAGNTSFGLPGRHTLGAAFLAVAQSHGLTSAIMDSRRPEMVEARARDRLPARPRRVGRDLDPHVPREAGGGDDVSALEDLPEEPHPDRVRLRFLQSGEDRAVKEARVLAGTTIFDAASWNGVAIDSTCGGHGTCKKCKVKVVSGHAPISSVDPRAFTIEELKNGWRLACRANDARGPHDRGAAAADAAEGGARRRRPPRDPAARGAEALRRARRADARGPDVRSRARCSRRWTTSSRACRSTSCASSAARCARANWKVTAVLADDVLIDVEPGDTSGSRHAIAFDLGTTTVVATLLDLETGQPKAVRSILNAQQPFGADVISRISAIMMDDDALDDAAAARARDAAAAHRRGVRGGGRRSGRGLRDRRRRQPDDDPDRARHRPGAALDGAVHGRRAPHAGGDRRRLRRRRAPARARGHVPGARRVRRPRHRRRHPRDRASRSTGACASSSTSARTPRSCSAPRRRRSRPRRRPGLRSRRRRSAAACAPPTARSRA